MGSFVGAFGSIKLLAMSSEFANGGPSEGWRAAVLAAPPAEGEWARWALGVAKGVPAVVSERPLAWIGAGRRMLGWFPQATFGGGLLRAARDFRAWAASARLGLAEGGAHLTALGAFDYDGLGGDLVVPGVALIHEDETRLVWHESRGAVARALLEAAENSGTAGGGLGNAAPRQLREAAEDRENCEPAAAQTPAEIRESAPEWTALEPTVPLADWQDSLQRGIDRLNAGEAAKFVMARDQRFCADRPVHIAGVLRSLAGMNLEPQPTAWVFAIRDLVGATPEVLARTSGGRFHARILAGTRPAGCGEELLADPKEWAEHQAARASVTEKLRSLGMSDVQVSEPHLLHLPNVDHLQTTITAATDQDSAQLAAAFHPTAAICGTPTEAAERIIREIEGMERGAFTGPVGWINADGDGQWNIALRCAQTEVSAGSSREWRLLAGAGIMPASSVKRETAETGVKMGLMRAALGIEG